MPSTPDPHPQSARHDGCINPLTPGALSAVIALGPTPNEREWSSARDRGTIVLRSLVKGDAPAWLPASRRAWDDRLALLTALAQRHAVRPLLWPHAQDVVSDVPGIVTFCRAQPTPHDDTAPAADRGWGVLLDPAALLTPDMLTNAGDHLARVRDALDIDCVRARVAAVVLRETGVVTEWWRTHAAWEGALVTHRASGFNANA
jgi:hypothetical protein